MRNLKKLFAVLLVVAMVASMMVPALAAITYQSEALKLQAIKVFAGGPDDLKLDQGVTRAQGIAFAIRVAGKDAEAQALTDEEVDEILADWVDADELTGAASWARKYVAYAVKTGMTHGVGGQKLAALQNITGTSLMVFVLKAMGYSDVTTANVAELAVEYGIMSYADAAKFAAIQEGLIRDDAAGILYNAFANGVTKDGTPLIDAYIASGAITEADAIAAGFKEEVLDAVTAKAIGARKIEVSLNKAVEDTSKVTIEIKRGMVKPNVKSVTWAEDKKSAVVEFTSDLVTDNYTVKVTGAAEEALTYSFAVEAAKLVSIAFDTDYAILQDNGDLKMTVSALNQYGEKVNISSATVTTNKSGATANIDSKGELTVVKPSAGEFKVDDKILIVIVKDNVNASATITVAAAASVQSIEFGAIQTSNDDLKGKDIRVSYMQTSGSTYYIPVTLKDQYGNTLKKTQVKDVQIIVSPANIIAVKSSIQEKDGNTIIEFENVVSGSVAGTAVITLVAPSTGKTASTTVVVNPDAKIDVVSVSSPESDLKQGKATKLPVELTDTYGEAVTLFSQKDITSGETTDITFSDASLRIIGGTFVVEKDYINSVTTIKVKPGSSATSVTIIATSATGKTQTLVFSVLDAPKAVAIKGLKSDFVSMLANDPSCGTSLKGAVEFLDQYGDVIEVTYATTATTASGIYYTVTATSTPEATTANIDSNDAKVTAQAVSEKKSDKYKITLKGTGLSEDPTLEVEITVIPLNDIAEFEIKEVGKIYTGTSVGSNGAHSRQVKVVGKVDGKEVAIPQTFGVDKVIKEVKSNVNDLTFENNDGKIMSKVAKKIDTEGNDKTGKVKVMIVTNKTVKLLEKEFAYNSADPAVSSIEIKKGEDTVSGVVELAQTSINNINLTDSPILKFVAKDQYGENYSGTPQFFITNNDTGATITVSTNTISVSGTPTVGKSFVVNCINEGVLSSIKVVVTP